MKPISYTHNGQTKSSTEWAKELGIGTQAFNLRIIKLRKGRMSYDEVFHPGDIKSIQKKVTHNGITLSYKDWADMLGIKLQTFKARLNRFRDGKITEDQCYTSGHIERDNILKVTIDGKKYTAQGLANRLGIPIRLAKNRMLKFNRGTISKKVLMTKGKIDAKSRDFTYMRRYVLNDGTHVSLSQLAEQFCISRDTIKNMIDKGMSIDEIYEWGIRPNKHIRGYYWIDGKKIPTNKIMSVSEVCGMTLNQRLYLGWDFQEALSTPTIQIQESISRARSVVERNRRKRELNRMGIVV